MAMEAAWPQPVEQYDAADLATVTQFIYQFKVCVVLFSTPIQRQKSPKNSGEQNFARKNFPDDKKVWTSKFCVNKIL